MPGIDGNRTRNPLIQSQGFNPIYHGTSMRPMLYSNTAVNGGGGGGGLSMVTPVTCLFFKFLKHLMMFLKCNFFRASSLHIMKDTDIM